MSKFLDDALRAQEKLNEVSPSMCLAKWVQTSLHLTTGHTNSCYHPSPHKINPMSILDNPSALHNTPEKKEARREMLEGTRCAECSYCWNIEDTDNLSDRQYRSGEPWAFKRFDEILANGWEKDIDPSYVEVNFNSACNLKCSYCSPQFSSSWMAEAKQFGPYPTSTKHNDPEYFRGARSPIPNNVANPYLDAFWKWWPILYPSLKHFRMTGGEPLMDKNTYKIFDYVLNHPKKDLHLAVTSNFSVEPELFKKYIGYVKRLCTDDIEHFMQYVSLDAMGPRAEYIRNGLDFERLRANVNTFLKDIPNRNSLTFIITMNNLSLSTLESYMGMILKLRSNYSDTYQRVWFDTPLLRQPVWQSIQILPKEYEIYIEQTLDYMRANLETEDLPFKGFKDYEIQRLERDLAWWRANIISDAATKKDFYLFFTEYDKRHGTDFNAVFPEMREFWASCQR